MNSVRLCISLFFCDKPTRFCYRFRVSENDLESDPLLAAQIAEVMIEELGDTNEVPQAGNTRQKPSRLVTGSEGRLASGGATLSGAALLWMEQELV
jgi:hypothetical protein